MLILLIICTVFAFICRSMAIKRGRDGKFAILLGFLFGIFAVIGYAIAGETEAHKVARLRAIFRD